MLKHVKSISIRIELGLFLVRKGLAPSVIAEVFCYSDHLIQNKVPIKDIFQQSLAFAKALSQLNHPHIKKER